VSNYIVPLYQLLCLTSTQNPRNVDEIPDFSESNHYKYREKTDDTMGRFRKRIIGAVTVNFSALSDTCSKMSQYKDL
jgi:hypothetical protein